MEIYIEYCTEPDKWLSLEVSTAGVDENKATTFYGINILGFNRRDPSTNLSLFMNLIKFLSRQSLSPHLTNLTGLL